MSSAYYTIVESLADFDNYYYIPTILRMNSFYTNIFRYDQQNKVITGYYNDDISVDSLHDIVLKVLFEQSTTVVTDLIGDGLTIASKPDVTVEDGIGFFSRLFSGISNITEQSPTREYEKRARCWIQAINKESDAIVKRDFITQYISIVGQYVRTNIQYSATKARDSNNKIECSVCCRFVEDETESHCGWCGAFISQFLVTSKYLESSEIDIRPNKVIKDTYDKFREHYLRFQGRSKNTIAKEDLDKIRESITRDYHLHITEEFRSDNSRLLRGVITKMKLGKYKDDVNLIMNELWGYNLPDYRNLDVVIENNWRVGQPILDANKEEQDAQTISHNDWRLYKELTDVGVQVDENDFQISTNKQMKKRYEELWTLRCEEVARHCV